MVLFERNDGVGERALAVKKEVVGERGDGRATDASWVLCIGYERWPGELLQSDWDDLWGVWV